MEVQGTVKYLLLTLFVQISHQDIQQCEVTNIHVTQEDGTQQIFRVKRLQPVDSCSGCAENVQPTMPSPTSAEHPVMPPVTLVIGELAPDCEGKADVPVGLCSIPKDTDSCPHKKSFNAELLQGYASVITEKKLVPLSTGNEKIDKKIAYGIVLLNTGQPDEAIQHFTGIIKDHPNTMAAYHGRGAAYARKGLQFEANAVLALTDFSKAIDLDNKRPEGYERRAEVLIPLGQHSQALEDLNKAIELKPSAKLYFLRGTVRFLTQHLKEAETDFRKALQEGDGTNLNMLYHLGLTLFYRGKIRNAVEVFKDALKQDSSHTETLLSLGQAYKEIGNIKQAKAQFNKSLSNHPNHVMTLQLEGIMLYQNGDLSSAIQDLDKCISVDPDNRLCQYMKGLAHTAMGQFYEGIKAHTKVMVSASNTPVIKMSPEVIKAHYLRDYSRYLHQKVDSSISGLNIDVDLDGEFRDHWAKGLPFQFEGAYKEQPGLQPHISDVTSPVFYQYQRDVQHLICRANKIGWLMQVSADGFLPNKRLNLAMGMAAIHIAQLAEGMWKGLIKGKYKGKRFSWKDLFDLAVQYRRLVDPDQPVLWLDKMTDEHFKDGYKTDVNFIRGDVANIRMLPYFDLVFKLVKTMLTHYQGDGAVTYPGYQEELDQASTCVELLKIAKKRKINHQGFMVSTQVPSFHDKNNLRHEGVIVTLTGDSNGQVTFSLNTATTKSRTASFHSELDQLFNKLDKEIRRTGANKMVDFDAILNLILSLGYYFYNLMPLSRGTSVVAYSVILGLVMSLGKEVTGKIPQGKLLDMEAMLSGAPDAFILVAKQWMNIKKISTPVSQLPKVSEVFPTIRTVIEALNAGADSC